MHTWCGNAHQVPGGFGWGGPTLGEGNESGANRGKSEKQLDRARNFEFWYTAILGLARRGHPAGGIA